MLDDGVFAVIGNVFSYITLSKRDYSKVEMSDVVYDVNEAVVSNPQLVGSYESDLTNNTDIEQEQTFNFEIDYSETHNWSSTVQVKLGVETTIKTGIPFLLQGLVKVTVEGQYSTTWGTSITEGKNILVPSP
jgi:hypothetical protein